VTEDGFTLAVRLELAGLPVPSEREARAELAGMLLMGRRDLARAGWLMQDRADRRPGDLPLSGLCADGLLAVVAPSSAVARRAIALLHGALGVRPALTAVSVPGRVAASPAYRVSLPAELVRARERAGGPAPVAWSRSSGEEGSEVDAETVALLRGAFIAGGSLSNPERAVHLELAPLGPAAAPLLVGALQQVVTGSSPRYDGSRGRIVIKSGAVVSDLLAALGATRAFLTYDDRRLRRQLRGEANRLANADAANLARVASRAGAQVDAIERTVAAEGWEAFDEDHRTVALARLANPSASITELAQLLGLPRSTLHRRLAHLERTAREAEGPLC
jgi:cell division protein WhiA